MTQEVHDELETGLKRRDRRFILRLLMLLTITLLASVWLAGRLTQTEVGGCAARGFFDVTQPSTPDGRPHEATP